ncbi:sigma-70 family RNA polymerase sigma factor [Chloroflexales bacterium ZM16-3]|nr:sigma-70 family RNA polymerase sigma factor [Chloroflexales bacterium ZM16-3]
MTQTMSSAQPAAPLSGAQTSSAIDLSRMDFGTLMSRCAVESRLFYSHQDYDSRFAYELFRRALVERSEDAWEHIYQHYFQLVEHWVRRTGAFTVSGETSDFFVSAAFTRFWRAIPAERFSSFPSLAALLNYLRRCASCVVIDSARAHSYADLLPEECINWNTQKLSHADEEATERVSRAEFWQLVDGMLQSEAERVVVRSSFLLGMKPGDIFAARGDLFSDVSEVYALKRNILVRLRRNPELKGMY